MKKSTYAPVGFVIALGLTAAVAKADLALTFNAGTTLNTNYRAPDISEGIPALLQISTTNTHPASLNYVGQSGSLEVEFLAPEGYQFTVNPGAGPVSIFFQFAYTTGVSGAAGGLTATAPATFTLLGVGGSAPSFSVNSTFGDIPHAYLAVSASANDVVDGFSFTGFRISRPFSGTGLLAGVPYFEGGNFTVSQSDYAGAPPPGNLPLLAITAIPEPSAWASVLGASALVFASCRRRRRLG